MSPARSLLSAGLIASALLCSGCIDALEAFEKEDNLLHVFATHHATPDAEGNFPNRGGDDLPRVFENDLGWTITLTEGFVVTTNVTLQACNGKTVPMDMFWGPCPEDMSEADLDPSTVAGGRLDAGNYCTAMVQYAPYDPDAPAVSESKHPAPDNPAVEGSTIYLRGVAQNVAGDSKEFTLRSTDLVVAELDMSTLEKGGPLTIAKESFPEEITVSKTYDRFFDGVDFNSLDEATLAATLAETLRRETRISHGTVVD